MMLIIKVKIKNKEIRLDVTVTFSNNFESSPLLKTKFKLHAAFTVLIASSNSHFFIGSNWNGSMENACCNE